MTSADEISGKTAELNVEGYLEPSETQDADINTFTGIKDMYANSCFSLIIISNFLVIAVIYGFPACGND